MSAPLTVGLMRVVLHLPESGSLKSKRMIVSGLLRRVRQQLKVAAAEVNEKGGVLGRPIELLIEDDASNQNAALTAAEKLVNQGVPLIVGAFASSVTKPLGGYLTRVKVPLLNTNSADTSITKPGGPYIFRSGQTTDTYADASFDLLKTFPGLKTVALLVSNDALGRSTATSGGVPSRGEACTSISASPAAQSRATSSGSSRAGCRAV